MNERLMLIFTFVAAKSRRPSALKSSDASPSW